MTSSFLLLLLLLALAQLLCPVLSSSKGSLCILMYSLPGTVDYPFSIAYDLQLTYDPTPVIAANQTQLNILAGSGTRTYTNRFGVSTSTSVVMNGLAAQADYSGIPLSLAGGVPFTSLVPISLSSPVQLPGVGSSTLVSSVVLHVVGGSYIEIAGAFFLTNPFDPLGQAYLSSIPGFINTTILASNVNTLAVQTQSAGTH